MVQLTRKLGSATLDIKDYVKISHIDTDGTSAYDFNNQKLGDELKRAGEKANKNVEDAYEKYQAYIDELSRLGDIFQQTSLKSKNDIMREMEKRQARGKMPFAWNGTPFSSEISRAIAENKAKGNNKSHLQYNVILNAVNANSTPARMGRLSSVGFVYIDPNPNGTYDLYVRESSVLGDGSIKTFTRKLNNPSEISFWARIEDIVSNALMTSDKEIIEKENNLLSCIDANYGEWQLTITQLQKDVEFLRRDKEAAMKDIMVQKAKVASNVQSIQDMAKEIQSGLENCITQDMAVQYCEELPAKLEALYERLKAVS